MSHVKLFESFVNEVTSAEIWKAVDKAQLEKFEKDGPNEMTLGDIEYRVGKCFMDEHDVPTLEIIAKKTNQVNYVALSVVWSSYENWSAMGPEGRETLRQKYLS